MPRAVLPHISHERVAAVVDRVLGRFIANGDLRADEAEDVRSAVLLKVLQQVDASERGEAVRSAEDYVARMTINAANDVLRSRPAAPVALTDRDRDARDDAQRLPDALATRQMLVLLWEEIGKLPQQQRRALLLHVRDGNGGSVIPLLIFTGVATLGEIATVLGYEPGEIETLWDRLPMADLEIAGLLSMTRQQVIGLRRSARERLERARQRLLTPRRVK
jgi:hypothetical protein